MPRKGLSLTLLIALFLSITVTSLTVPPTRAEAKQLSITVVCLEFPDARHSSSIEAVKWTAIDRVNQFYMEVSYGQLSVVGEIYGWFMMPAPLSKFDVTRWGSPSEACYRLVQVAQSVAESNRVKIGSYTFLVFSGGVWGFAYSSLRISVQNEMHAWYTYAHELGHTLGLPDLYSYEKASIGESSHIFVGSWDIMGSGSSGQMCAWSRIKLGWIPKTQILSVNLGLRGTVATISPLEEGKGILAMKISKWYDIHYYLIEVRLGRGVLITDIDETKKGGYGIVRVVVARPNSAIVNLGAACLDLWGNGYPAYSDIQNDVGIIILGKAGSTYNIIYTTASKAKEATEAHWSIMMANSTIQRAQREIRLEGLDKARAAMLEAIKNYEEMNFKDSLQVAKNAKRIADEATIPRAYYDAKQGIETVESKLTKVTSQAFESKEAKTKLGDAEIVLEDAKQAFLIYDFQLALTYLERCNSLISEAEQAEANFQERKRQQEIILIVAVAVVTVILVVTVVRMRRKKLNASLSAEQARLQSARWFRLRPRSM